MTLGLTIILVITSIVLIASVLLQSGKSAGLGSIAGGADQLFGKGASMDAFLAKLTTVSAVAFMLSAVLLTIFQK